jgi:hypothetical protein
MYFLAATCPHEIRERFVPPAYILIYIYNPTLGRPLALLRGPVLLSPMRELLTEEDIVML